MSKRAMEYLFLLQRNLKENELIIEGICSTSSWGTEYFEVACAIRRFVRQEAVNKSTPDYDRVEEWEHCGLAAVLDFNSVELADNFEDAIDALFHFAYDRGIIKDDY